jgi:hypothetical protein
VPTRSRPAGVTQYHEICQSFHRHPGRLAGALCAVVTAAAVATYQATTTARVWTPLIAATAATIGLTVTIVEGILHREAEERSRPWRDAVLGEITRLFWDYLDTIALDYAETHIESFVRSPVSQPRFSGSGCRSRSTRTASVG